MSLRLTQDVGIPKRSLHKIRKTYASILRENGLDDAFIISQMGHTNIQTTEQFYIRNRDTAKMKAEKINSVFEKFPAAVTKTNQQRSTPRKHRKPAYNLEL